MAGISYRGQVKRDPNPLHCCTCRPRKKHSFLAQCLCRALFHAVFSAVYNDAVVVVACLVASNLGIDLGLDLDRLLLRLVRDYAGDDQSDRRILAPAMHQAGGFGILLEYVCV